MTTATLDEATADVAAETSGKKPLKTFRYRNISASVFENDAKNGGTFLTVSLQRAYKDGDEFKHSSSFTRDEIPVARQMLAKAWDFVMEEETK